MQDFYYEVLFTPTAEIDLIAHEIVNTVNDAIEIDDGTVILRTVEDPNPLIEHITSYVNTISLRLDQTIDCVIVSQKKKNQDWVQAYKDGFSPVIVGNFYIRASWHEANETFSNIIIDPDLVFGTGHHATTRLSLEAMQSIILSNKSFLDVGCGSGLLGIAALKLGAIASACDIDPLATHNTLKNSELNNVSFDDIWVGSAFEAPKSYDVVVANIVSDILVALKKQLILHTKPNGILILSGIMEKYLDSVKNAYSSLHLTNQLEQDGWFVLIYQKQEEI
jgi:ribosomal protein L11 methyltransferase